MKIYLHQLVDANKISQEESTKIWKVFLDECEKDNESGAWFLVKKQIDLAIEKNN